MRHQGRLPNVAMSQIVLHSSLVPSKAYRRRPFSALLARYVLEYSCSSSAALRASKARQRLLSDVRVASGFVSDARRLKYSIGQQVLCVVEFARPRDPHRRLTAHASERCDGSSIQQKSGLPCDW